MLIQVRVGSRVLYTPKKVVRVLIAPLSMPDLTLTLIAIHSYFFEMNGVDDGARTRDLCRDSPPL
jgi:hypothetical protein